jgi:hypothetical protein
MVVEYDGWKYKCPVCPFGELNPQLLLQVAMSANVSTQVISSSSSKVLFPLGCCDHSYTETNPQAWWAVCLCQEEEEEEEEVRLVVRFSFH